MKNVKKVEKKLVLKKETVANLKNNEMTMVFGGSCNIIRITSALGNGCITNFYSNANCDQNE